MQTMERGCVGRTVEALGLRVPIAGAGHELRALEELRASSLQSLGG